MPSDELVGLFAKKFIARPDVKAEQRKLSDGKVIYVPTETKNRETGEVTNRSGFEWDDIVAHLEGNKTYGHYLLSESDQVKLFCLDVDFKEHGLLPASYNENGVPEGFIDTEQLGGDSKKPLIDDWHDRASPHRNWNKFVMCHFAAALSTAIGVTLQIQTATAYSGNKGFHVYGFTGLMPATDARLGMNIALESMKYFKPLKGEISVEWDYEAYQDDGNDNSIIAECWQNFSVELFPKQDSISETAGYGNLVRLPLGTNLKNPDDPTFFFDVINSPIELGNCFAPVDAEWALNYLAE